MNCRGTTPRFRGLQGKPSPGSIAEIKYVRLGGVDQWVMIRGASVANPILVLLHGGPGFPEMRLFRHFNASLEKSFTVVYWDQRGTNKSFDRNIPRSSMTVEQFIADLDELVDAVRMRFAQDRVVIYGHSWGSALGVLWFNQAMVELVRPCIVTPAPPAKDFAGTGNVSQHCSSAPSLP